MIFIQVTEPVFKDAKLRKHVNYLVSGHDSQGQFHCRRRYKEFNSLRRSLLRRWPGLLIPSIPGKQMIGNLGQDFVLTRMQLLNDFLVKVSQVSYLFNCEEVQTFLRGSADFCKTSEDFKEKTTVEIAENYSELFQESIFFQSLPEEDAKVQKWFEVFSVFLNNLENFSQSCKTVFENFSCFENSVNEMISGINEITSFYSQTYEFSSSEIPRRPAYSNPYSLPLDWSRVVILDIKAVIELISSRSKLIKSKTKTKEKLEIEGKKLEEKKTGKKKISQIFSKTTKEQRVAKQEKKIQELEIELKSYEKICKIVTEKFLNVEVSQLRKSLNESFRHIIEKFAESISGEIDEIFIQFMPLKTMFDEQILKDS